VRIASRNSHGTGCAFSATIAAGLAKGMELEAAIRSAKSYVHAAIAAADTLEIGSGAGPVHHFHAMWPGLSTSPCKGEVDRAAVGWGSC
jgi:hydroxymethylpyrimidine/phosphomethylpyrimidine kinase